ncbi:MAG: hypothetical protein Q8R28_23305 [Dehalococcoidia bacterium]|nr:hypothetical protein [Dehalococcoidia bacterium]
MDLEEFIQRLSACMDEGATDVFIRVDGKPVDIADDFDGEGTDSVVLAPKQP